MDESANSKSVLDEQSNGNNTNEISELEILAIFGTFNSWLKVPIDKPRTDESQQLDVLVFDGWNRLTDIIKTSYPFGRKYVAQTTTYAGRVLKKVRGMIEKKKKETKRNKDEVDRNQILTAALGCITQSLIAITNDFEEGGFSQEIYSSFGSAWLLLLDNILRSVVEADSFVGCAMLDVVAAIGYDIYSQIPEHDQRRLTAYLLCHGGDTDSPAQIRAKIGRCLAKFIEFPSLQDDVSFFMDVFEITTKSLLRGESVVKISYAWTFGNLTDALIKGHVSTFLTEEPVGFVRVLLQTAIKCTDVPARGRYSACRASGNILRWLKPHMLHDLENRRMVVQLTTYLLTLVGNGLDYKLRWNAAHALGSALENNMFSLASNASVINPIIKTLAKWAARSQNYKERTQCMASLIKAKEREMYGPLYPYVWERLCVSMSRLPVEECDSVDKFKMEAVLMVFHLIAILKFEDLGYIDSTILTYTELLTSMVTECLPNIPCVRLDDALSAKENVKGLLEMAENSPRHETLCCLREIIKPVDSSTEDSSNL